MIKYDHFKMTNTFDDYLKTPASNPYLRKLLKGQRILSCPR